MNYPTKDIISGSIIFCFPGMGMLADGYKDSKERGRAMGTSFTGLALGLIGM